MHYYYVFYLSLTFNINFKEKASKKISQKNCQKIFSICQNIFRLTKNKIKQSIFCCEKLRIGVIFKYKTRQNFLVLKSYSLVLTNLTADLKSKFLN
jgi:hypothetical protein